jgi:hypothetical protein
MPAESQPVRNEAVTAALPTPPGGRRTLAT